MKLRDVAIFDSAGHARTSNRHEKCNIKQGIAANGICHRFSPTCDPHQAYPAVAFGSRIQWRKYFLSVGTADKLS
jgi:hypothetical protein